MVLPVHDVKVGVCCAMSATRIILFIFSLDHNIMPTCCTRFDIESNFIHCWGSVFWRQNKKQRLAAFLSADLNLWDRYSTGGTY